MSSCKDFLRKLQECNNTKLIDYIIKEFDNLLNDSNINEIIYSALPYNSDEENVNKIYHVLYRATHYSIIQNSKLQKVSVFEQ